MDREGNKAQDTATHAVVANSEIFKREVRLLVDQFGAFAALRCGSVLFGRVIVADCTMIAHILTAE